MIELLALYLLVGVFVLAVIVWNGLPLNEGPVAASLCGAIIVLTWPLVVALAFQK